MSETVLITGGAGFIGSHLADELRARGNGVRVLDSLVPQVHEGAGAADIVGDIRDAGVVRRALEGVDSVVHLAARVGVGQSMYEMAEYTSANSVGTAVLLEALAERPVRKLVVASSMSIYGEGLYSGGDPGERTRARLERREWDFPGLEPLPTPETKRPVLSSIYALTKYDQERACLLAGAAYGIPTVALRLFNVYGPGQALSNPYTGVLAIFASRLLNDRAPRVFEDGLQRRDFVSVHDVARAFATALESDGADGLAVNVGSGRSIAIVELGELLARTLGKEIEPEVTGEFRVGDIRHCFADVALAKRALGFEAQVELEDGIAELAEWLAGRTAVDRVDEATAELAKRGLTG
ncbi:MAG: NAD-dependent epimerase/dehydratase family protein [Acidobacteriota bacterium]|nr:NAD-dependent epimerase/dehydratase family protein [Acidobacteriota bacterium]